ncbi:MAG: Unknown protein, partial [uncultured Aureispira sp.]
DQIPTVIKKEKVNQIFGCDVSLSYSNQII